MPARKRRRYERVRRRSRLRGSISLAGGIFTLMSFHNMHYKVKIGTGHFFIFSGTAKRDCYPRPKEDIVQFRGCLTTYCTHHPISWAKDRQTQLHHVHIYHCEHCSLSRRVPTPWTVRRSFILCRSTLERSASV